MFNFKKIIYGCDSDNGGDTPYLTRYSLFKIFGIKCMLHIFHRSDHEDALHDHPWPFVSIILWRGYVEESACKYCKGTKVIDACNTHKTMCRFCGPLTLGYSRKRYYPGSILFRPAKWIHRVELVKNKPAVTLVFAGKKEREWGFWTDGVWEKWTEYFKRLGC